ncbi:MAG: T9SS type A sorting domain-containing protein, partial [Bacteroidales bacterium]|nr:T9SS type A sorting domain-containing protein [Bacteroidales bacterium]
SYGAPADIYSTYCSGNGNDGYYLYKGGNHTAGTLLDAYGVIGVDGTGELWEYTDGHAVRKRGVTQANATWTDSEWTITRFNNNDAQMTPWQWRANRVWQGTTSTNWNAKGNNWDGNGFVPDASDIVTVPGTVTNWPVVNANSGCHDLTLSSGTALIVTPGNQLNVNGTLVNPEGINGLLLQSSSSGTAALLHYTPGVQATHERYIAADQWHYISSPVNNCVSQVYLDIYLKSFNEPDSAWTYIVPTTVPLNNMQGYATYSPTGLLGNTTVYYQGALNLGNFSRTTTYTTGASHFSKGWNFVGNPYACPIDWDRTGWTRTNINDKLRIWNPSIGNYGSYDAGVPQNGVNNIIPPHQGFFVECNNAGGGTIGVSNNTRWYFYKAFMKDDGQPVHAECIRLSTGGNGYSDETLIRFNENASPGHDDMDSPKWYGLEAAPQLYSFGTENHIYCVNAIPSTEGNEVIGIGYRINTTGSYTITAEGLENLDASVPVWLEDRLTGDIVNLREQFDYTFLYSTGEPEHRFNLHFAVPYGIGEENASLISIYSSGQEVYVSVPETGGEILIYNVMGQEVRREPVTSSLNRITLEPTGYYVVRVINGERLATRKVHIQ